MEEPQMHPRNVAARAGRWSAQHRKTAILGWILFVVLATVLGGQVGQNDLDESASRCSSRARVPSLPTILR
jgi:RND superfamily putative drug exporter